MLKERAFYFDKQGFNPLECHFFNKSISILRGSLLKKKWKFAPRIAELQFRIVLTGVV